MHGFVLSRNLRLFLVIGLLTSAIVPLASCGGPDRGDITAGDGIKG